MIQSPKLSALPLVLAESLATEPGGPSAGAPLVLAESLAAPLVRAAALVCLTLWSVAAGAADLYAAPDGNDILGSGTILKPFATLNRAYLAAQSGDRIVLRAGDYTGGLWVRKPNITITSAPGERARILFPASNPGLANNLWFLAPGGKVQGVEVVGGSVYCIKFEAGPGLVENCIVRDAIDHLVKVVPYADGVIIRRCELYRTIGINPNLTPDGRGNGIDNVAGDRMIVQGCYIHDIVGAAAYAKGGSIGCVFDRNLIVNCSIGILLGQDTGTEFFRPDENPKYYDNINGTVRNNVIVNTWGTAVGMYGALNPKVLNNTLINVAQVAQGGIFMTSNSVFPGGIQTFMPCQDPQIINNVVTLGATSPRAHIYIMPGGLSGTLTLRNNRYYNAGGAAQFWDASRYITPVLFAGNLAQWAARFGETGSSEGDPGLAADYQMPASSPLRGAGWRTWDVLLDYNGNLRMGAYDIGACQMGGPLLSIPPPPGTVGTGGR